MESVTRTWISFLLLIEFLCGFVLLISFVLPKVIIPILPIPIPISNNPAPDPKSSSWFTLPKLNLFISLSSNFFAPPAESLIL